MIELITESIPELDIEKITIIEGTQGNTVSKMVSFIEQLKQTTGVDLSKISEQLKVNQPPAPECSSQMKLAPRKELSDSDGTNFSN